VHSLLGDLLVGSLAYLGTMLDNLFAFASQLALTPREKFRSMSVAQSLGVVTLVVLAVAVGSALNVIPVRWIGLLAAAPWWLGWRAWRSRDATPAAVHSRRLFTTFAVTFALGGDNLAVWIPLFRASGLVRLTVVLGTFAAGQVLFHLTAWGLAGHPKVREHGARVSQHLLPFLYGALGVLVVIECGTLRF